MNYYQSDHSVSIIVVDDVVENLHVIRDVLSESRFKLRLFKDARRALESAMSRPPDLFLLDVAMPNFSGFEMCQRIRVHTGLHSIPVIFISGRTSKEDICYGLGLGLADYVTKPFHVDEVVARVLNMCQVSKHLKDYEVMRRNLDKAKLETRHWRELNNMHMQLLQRFGTTVLDAGLFNTLDFTDSDVYVGNASQILNHVQERLVSSVNTDLLRFRKLGRDTSEPEQQLSLNCALVKALEAVLSYLSTELPSGHKIAGHCDIRGDENISFLSVTVTYSCDFETSLTENGMAMLRLYFELLSLGFGLHYNSSGQISTYESTISLTQSTAKTH